VTLKKFYNAQCWSVSLATTNSNQHEEGLTITGGEKWKFQRSGNLGSTVKTFSSSFTPFENLISGEIVCP
jgi:hypothetical protein